MHVEDLIADGDKSVGPSQDHRDAPRRFMGVRPSGTSVDVELIDIMRFDGAGLVCEHWGLADMLSLM